MHFDFTSTNTTEPAIISQDLVDGPSKCRPADFWCDNIEHQDDHHDSQRYPEPLINGTVADDERPYHEAQCD